MSDRAKLDTLGRGDCYRLLRSTPVGRVAVTLGALPAILPVRYVVVDGDVVFRASAGGTLVRAANGRVIALEADHLEEGDPSGWSVLVVGWASLVEDAATLGRIQPLGLRSWDDGEDVCLRLAARMVTGRRLGPPAPRPARALPEDDDPAEAPPHRSAPSSARASAANQC